MILMIMKNKIFLKVFINSFYKFITVGIRKIWIIKNKYSFIKKGIKSINFSDHTRKEVFPLIILLSLWVQVPQWEDDWAKCAIDIPDSSCHWYVKSPDNTFGEGFDWDNAPLFDVNGLNDIAKIDKQTVLEKLQNK